MLISPQEINYMMHLEVCIHWAEKMEPEEKARVDIDNLLREAGWDIQDKDEFNPNSSLGIAVREYPLETGEADYLLWVDGKAIGVVEAKPKGTTLTGIEEQTKRYLRGFPEGYPCVERPLPFAYESTGVKTQFRNLRDPHPRSRKLFAFHKPKTLQKWVEEEESLRERLKSMPPLETERLRDCQIDAIRNLEKSFADNRPRALIQMASGSGKTYAAVSFIYRLIKFADAKRVLFLVDRTTLGRQTKKEFQQYSTPHDGRKFTELYNVQHMTTNNIDKVSRVCITTIQRLFSMLKGEEDLEEEEEDESLFEKPPEDEEQKEVEYNPDIPIETFDFIVTDECHRSIYNLWRQVLEYFDAFIIGLTATPSKQTFGFFNQNLVTEYGHERAVADGVNVGYDVYRIKTKITEEGSKVEAGHYVDKRNKETRERRWEQLDDDLDYSPKELDRKVVSESQIRTIIRTFKEKLFTEIFPHREVVPKTLIFAKTDSHAEDIVRIVREEFGKGNEFCKKITYKSYEDPEKLISSFRNSYNPRIAVTVDKISTGTDIRPLECILFMRDVNSRVYFEQMKGRGTRVIEPTDLQSVTPHAKHKTHFVIVDAVGACESKKTDSRPLERSRSVPFDTLIENIGEGKRDEDSVTSLGNRLARMDRKLSEEQKKEIEEVVDKDNLSDMINKLFDAVDPDRQKEKARSMFDTDEPDEEKIEKATEELKEEACRPFEEPKVRKTIKDIKTQSEQIIDKVSQDETIESETGFLDSESANSIVDTFEKFIEENKNEITALQMIYNRSYGSRELTYEQIKEVAQTIKKPPYNLTPERVWEAYERLEEAKNHGAGSKKLLTNIISILEYEIGNLEELEPYPELVEDRFQEWLESQREQGREFTNEELKWLRMIKEHISTSLSIEKEDFEYAPFIEKGGLGKFYNVFGDETDKILEEMNEVLTA